MGLLLHEQTSNVGPEMMKNLPQNKYFDIWRFLMSLGSESSGYMSQIRYCASLFNLEGHSVRSDRISSVNVQLPCTCIVVNLDHRKKEYYNKRAELDRNMD